MMYVNGRPANTDSIYHIRRSTGRIHRIGDSDMSVATMMTDMMMMAMTRWWLRGCTSTSRRSCGVVGVGSIRIRIRILLLLSPYAATSSSPTATPCLLLLLLVISLACTFLVVDCSSSSSWL